MRNIERIDQFLAEIGKIWKEECPDWRFGQLINNLQRYTGNDLFYSEEGDILMALDLFFNKEEG